MSVFELLKNNYFSLFVRREGKVVLGKSYSNLWLLVGVLTATFLAISFSNASLKYLRHKMDDPFINWVDIKTEFGNRNASINLEAALNSDEMKEEYHFRKHQADYIFNFYFCGREGDHLRYFQIRFFQDFKNNDLVNSILDDDNVINDWKVPEDDWEEYLDENTVGVVMTEEAMRQLGYKEAPSYIYHYAASDYADEYGFDMLPDGYTASPIPVLGVVKRLPGNVDMIANAYLYQQLMNQNDYPFCMDRREYGETIHYYVPENVDADKFKNHIQKVIEKYPDSGYEVTDYFWLNEIKPFRKGEFISIEPEYVDFGELKAINAEVLDKYAAEDVHRVFSNAFSYYSSNETSFISVHFEDLDKIRQFEEYVHKEFGIRIEMAQINAKENFNAVSTMANILSWAIIVFAIVCIILFIVNLLQSYFQKVKRNLGTFKAFGMGNYELISVYMLIMAATILVSIFISLAVVWLSQGILDVFNITRDGLFGYLSLWSGKTISAILIIIFASVYTVYSVMYRLLRSTPGDLIYDR